MVEVYPTIPSLQEVIKPYGVCRANYSRDEDMWADIYAHLVGAYYLENSSVLAYASFRDIHSTSFLLDYYTSTNQKRIMPMYRVKNQPQKSGVIMNKKIKPIIKECFFEYLYRASGIRFNDRKIKKDSLVALCIDSLSWSSMLYKPVDVGGTMCSRVIYTTNEMSPHKMMTLYKQFGRNTTYRGTVTMQMNKLVPIVLNNMYKFFGTTKYKNKLKFRISPRIVLKEMTLTNGGGYLATRCSPDTRDILHKQTGAKAYLVVAALKVIFAMIAHYKKGTTVEFQPICIVRLKGEIKILLNKISNDLLKAQDKCREFFIPCLILTIISIFFMERMKYECGKIIKIGMRWWHGGAEELAIQLNYNMPDMIWVDGDIDGFDKSIGDYFLYLYMASLRYYYDESTMGDDERKVYNGFWRYLTYHLINKVVLHVGSIWTVMQGVMPSGAKETSHGDSWILAFYFYMFIEIQREKHPYAAAYIDTCLQAGFITIVVYGDDHIWCVPRALWGIINLEEWTMFLRVYCKSELRDGRSYNKFTTEINENSGLVVKPGPVFLKRYFIENSGPDDIRAKILPFRPVTEQIMKLFASENHEDMDYVVSSIGHALDTMGTNECSYRIIKKFYSYFKGRKAVSYKELVKRYKADPGRMSKLTDLVKKMGSEPENIYDCFPSRRRLALMHVYDKEKLKFGGQDDFTFSSNFF